MNRKNDGFTIERGSVVLMSRYVMHHHNPRYFPKQYLFSPDRRSKISKATTPRFSYLHFGGDIRDHIGELIEGMKGILVLATSCLNLKIHHKSNHKIELRPLTTL